MTRDADIVRRTGIDAAEIALVEIDALVRKSMRARTAARFIAKPSCPGPAPMMTGSITASPRVMLKRQGPSTSTGGSSTARMVN